MRGIYNENSSIIIKLDEKYKAARGHYRQLVRRARALDSYNRDLNLMNNPASTFSHIRQMKRNVTGPIINLKVGERVYSGEAVLDGFYDAIGQLKKKKPHLVSDYLPDTLDFVGD